MPPRDPDETRLLVFRAEVWDALWVDVSYEDEVRPITALFADLVGSTALGERLRPDEVKALVGECVSRMSAASEAYGGFVQAYQGDGICVFFGLPAAHEDDPERAALAALDILDLVADRRRDVADAWGITGFDVRVGVNTGSAAVGLVGDHSPHPVALGDVTNTAARLQGAAEPGTILVGRDTAKRLATQFRLEPAGPLALRGKQVPVDAWRLIGVQVVEHKPPQTLVGRTVELERVCGIVGEGQRGRGQVLLLSGSAGIGKTRLLQEVVGTASDEVVWIRGRARPYTGPVTYALLVDALRNWLEVGLADPPIVVRTRLRARGSDILPDACMSGLGSLLGLGTDLTIEPRTAILTWVEKLAERSPLVLVLDDLQWIDTTTRDAAEGLLCLTERLPLLLVLSLRPEPGSEGWALRMRALAEYPHRTSELSLAPLPNSAAADLVGTLIPAGDDATRALLLRQAEGNPLYLEELARDVLEGDAVRRDSWTLTALPAVGLPSTLESLLISRIDRLPAHARRLAQAAAVLGKSFSVDVLKAMTDDAQFDTHLQTLLRADVIRETRRFPTFECVFRHGLLQEAILSTLPLSKQRDLYAAAARAIEHELGEDTLERLELLAECYARSNDLQQALDYFRRAETRALELGAVDRASAYQRRAAKVAKRLESDES